MIKVSGNTYRTGWPYLLALLLLLPSCRQEDETAFTVGDSGFFLSLVEVAGENLTRTAPSELGVPEPEQFHLLVLKDDGRQIYDGNYASEISAPLGSYTLTASCGENVSLGLDAPYYEGTATAELTETEPHADVTIGCCVANALLSVKYVVADVVADGEEQTYTESDARFRKFFSDFGVKVSIGNQSVMLKNATASSAYFPAGSTIALQFYGTMLDPAGKTVTYDIPDTQNLFSDIAAGKHLILSLSYASIETGVVLTVEKVEVKQETISATIPLEWLPAPKLTGFADGSNVVTYTETADAVSAAIGYTTSAPLQDVEFTLDFQDENLNALNGTYLLSELTSEEKVTFAEAGIVIPVLGTKTGNFDFTDMTPTLLTNKGADVMNTIKLRVKANNRWSSEEGDVYTIKTVKPEFTVSVYPGNLWTKEFTVNELMESEVVTGSYAKLSTDMTYQYSTDGNTWTTIPGDRRQEGLASGTLYYIRGLYRGVVNGIPSSVKTYSEKQLTNGSLENSTILSGSDSKITGGAVYGWDGWATLNYISCPTGAACYSFNSRSGCRPTSDAQKGAAVRVITLGYGIGGWAKPTKAMHSELYLGVSADEDGNGIIYGIDWDSRPYALDFYYKCITNIANNDVSLVEIKVLHDNVVLGEAKFTTGAEGTYQHKMLEIDYSPYLDEERIQLSINKLSIVFKSGTKENLSVNDLKSFIGSLATTDRTADATYRGNELFIDEVSLNYDK